MKRRDGERVQDVLDALAAIVSRRADAVARRTASGVRTAYGARMSTPAVR